LINSLLPNLRWLCLPSDNLGQDWALKSQIIDQRVHAEGMDLSEESTYILFSEAPSVILDGLGQCLIARPVIGPKKNFESPFQLIDWKATPVWRQTLEGETLVDLLENADIARIKAIKGTGPFAEAFSMRVRRELKEELILSVEGIFHE
jgi:hypothetical protein